VEKSHDNKSLVELRQLAKGAVLSLVRHKIAYADLVKEGVSPQVLRELYGELGLRVDSEHSEPGGTDAGGSQTTFKPSQTTPFQSEIVLADSPDGSVPLAAASSTNPTKDSSFTAVPEAKKPQVGPNTSLERKDRIALLLAAKAGRPTPPPTAQAVSQLDEISMSTAAASVPDPTQPSLATSISVATPASQPDMETPSATATTTKSKAQTELVKRKMEQLRREAQARGEAAKTGAQQTTPNKKRPDDVATSLDQPQSSAPLPGSNAASFVGTHSLTSPIPGLFMNPAEFPGPESSANQFAPLQSLISSSVPAKRQSDEDSASSLPQPPSKKTATQHVALSGEFPVQPDQELDYESEGEIVEDSDADPVVVEQGPEQASQQNYSLTGPPDAALHYSNTSATFDVFSAAPVTSADAADSDQLYRAKQSQIEAMRRKISEMEQRHKLKRSRSQMESPLSSKAETPPVGVEEQATLSSPLSHAREVNGARQVSGSRPTAKLTHEQLQERMRVLKAEVFRQRAQRQQVLQEGLPDLNAEVKQAETRVDDARRKLARVRSQLEPLQAECERLVSEEKELSEQVTRLEEQLAAGRAGQKQYSEELQQIKLEKLAEERAQPMQQDQQHGAPAGQAVDSLGRAPTQLDNDEAAGASSAQPSKPVLDMSEGATAVTVPVDEEGDAKMQVDNDDEAAEGPPAASSSLASVPDAFAGLIGSEQQTPMQTDDGQSPAPGVTIPDEQMHAALDDQLGAGEMEISPEPEEYDQFHETLSTADQHAQASPSEGMAQDDDSDGSASMSGSDEEHDEDEEYEPAEADVPMVMQSDDEGEYDPESAPVDSATPTTAVTDANENINTSSGPEIKVSSDHAPVDQNAVPTTQAANSESMETLSAVPVRSQDDLESNALLTEADVVSKPPPGYAEGVPMLGGDSAPNAHYVPYKTPLSSFRNYRFHSEFNDAVKSGYRSLTYSNNIDPARPLCQTELSGKTCEDPKCEEQHFAQLGLPDEKILVQMSSASDISDKATKDAFTAGLKTVIADLRMNGAKDFEQVAEALSKYRRAFFAEREWKEHGDGEPGQPKVDQDDETIGSAQELAQPQGQPSEDNAAALS
jgi:hypothetical protein